MTLNELKTDTAALGFEKEIELDESFIGAVNRALGQIFTERRQRRTMRIFPRELSLSFFRKAITSPILELRVGSPAPEKVT